ncbi:MAG: hypothetical protein ACI822_002436 [Gammaproteobacteria bacterium]|jgi:hypothetical protein
MTNRKIDHQLEAKLKGGSGGIFFTPSGKLERKSYADGGERLKINLKNLDLSDESEATVSVDGVEVVRLMVIDGKAKYDQEVTNKQFFTSFQEGQTVKVFTRGSLFLSGSLKVD